MHEYLFGTPPANFRSFLREGCGAMHDCVHLGSSSVAPLLIGGAAVSNPVVRVDIDRSAVLLAQDGTTVHVDVASFRVVSRHLQKGSVALSLRASESSGAEVALRVDIGLTVLSDTSVHS